MAASKERNNQIYRWKSLSPLGINPMVGLIAIGDKAYYKAIQVFGLIAIGDKAYYKAIQVFGLIASGDKAYIIIEIESLFT